MLEACGHDEPIDCTLQHFSPSPPLPPEHKCIQHTHTHTHTYQCVDRLSRTTCSPAVITVAVANGRPQARRTFCPLWKKCWPTLCLIDLSSDSSAIVGDVRQPFQRTRVFIFALILCQRPRFRTGGRMVGAVCVCVCVYTVHTLRTCVSVTRCVGVCVCVCVCRVPWEDL